VIAKAIFGAVQMGLRQKPDQDRGPTT